MSVKACGGRSFVENSGRWGGGGGWTIKGRRDSFGMSLWKDIRKGWEEFSVETLI